MYNIKENQRKIVEALRSDKYIQGTGQMKSSSGCFCVWGVICDVSGLGEWEQDSLGYNNYIEGAIFPPKRVQDWAGIDEKFDIEIHGVSNDLMALNDGLGFTFKQMADAIEQQVINKE